MEFEGYPDRLGDLPVGTWVEMYNYEGVYRIIELVEGYQLAPNRQPLIPYLNACREHGVEPRPITQGKEGDGFHRPIMRPDGKLMHMSVRKPVRVVPNPADELRRLAELAEAVVEYNLATFAADTVEMSRVMLGLDRLRELRGQASGHVGSPDQKGGTVSLAASLSTRRTRFPWKDGGYIWLDVEGGAQRYRRIMDNRGGCIALVPSDEGDNEAEDDFTAILHLGESLEREGK